MILSGNCHKVKLILDLTKQPYEWVETDTRKQATRTEEFRQMNANTQVPLLQLPSGDYLPESNAILFYLAQGSSYWPEDSLTRARILQWMFFEQYSHEPYIAVNRARLSVFKDSNSDDPDVKKRHEKGLKTLYVMNEHLKQQSFFGHEYASIADIALFAYTHVAHEGGFDLTDFQMIEKWLSRCYDHGFEAMPVAN